MENFDAIVMLIGIVMIVAGIVLFVTGKVVSQNNQIEAFGVKINFNNPSFMLVVAGIGMVLVPRILPDPAKINQLPPPAAGISADSLITSSPSVEVKVDKPQKSVTQTSVPSQPREPAKLPPQKVSAPPLSGAYELLSYSINNIPQIVEGMLFLEPDGNNQYQWRTQFDSFDFYGNYMNFIYSGDLDFRNGGWYLDVNASNDPTWFDAGAVPTQVMHQGDLVSMSYVYNGAYIYSTWGKTNN